MAHLLSAKFFDLQPGHGRKQAAKLIFAVAGSLPPWKLTAAHVQEIDDYIAGGGFSHATRRNVRCCETGYDVAS